MNYKIILTVSFLLVFGQITYGQSVEKRSSRGKIGISFSSFGANDVDTGGILCDCSYDSDHFYSLGITYLHSINHWLSFETGIQYSKQTLRTHSFYPNRPKPHLSSSSDFTLIDIPLTVRAHFLRYFFANAGLLVDIDPNKSNPIGNQTGLGEMVGIGAQYHFNAGISLFANPYLKFHSNIPSLSHEDSFNLYESGFRFGILYHL